MNYLQQRVYNELGVPEELNKVLIHGEDRFGQLADKMGFEIAVGFSGSNR